ncbi:hypothetical protein L1049_023571 [Liquidambar formosana]|uniref:Uncharacterized protein n=1 Tax=Liquidambar formosana TaxID=63359 RepID=A0AAP0RT96_LIQFO
MGTAVLQSQSLAPKSTFLLLTKPQPSPTTNTQIFLYRRRPPLKISATNSSSSSSSSDTSSSDVPPPVQPPIRAPPETAEIRFRRGSRKRSRQLQQQDGGSAGIPKKAQAPPKDWEAMSLTEKAMELYVGEKGALFWLNKFAYASIFIMIGAWILFRFVGPSLNLYQLDAPPLSPSDVLKGS